MATTSMLKIKVALCWLHTILVWNLFSNNQKGLGMCAWSDPIWIEVLKWILKLNYVPCLHPFFNFAIIWWKVGLIIEATPQTNKIMQIFYLQIFNIYYMNSMGLLFSLHKLTMFL